jgi:hypothetical protein
MKLLLAMEFPSCNISVCNRVCNSVAHAFAAHSCNFPGHMATWEGVPYEIEVVVTSDLAGMNE